ncbi:ATP-binding cassette domain-containing protein [Nocardioides sp. zg-ZUI104]|uniref:oligopeptide/dipeptide ABC transporter ATP-binding protein n=1 Tax=Nocardioides faecalis TaxID=2803858 RepID=UPI001BCF4E50|nr:oligopeptide/dipeptide ABC transporter ATP-binding protein [Nocardioides faecalis]MBS4753850.1 ATP-binding cassette domain-containing protein [Nocardioides faecalis]
MSATTNAMTGDAPSARSAVLEVRGARKTYDVAHGRQRARLVAVDDITLQVHPGETVALVGESGCGKSTLARAAAMLSPLDAGEVLWSGQLVSGLRRRSLRARRGHTQLVFQDPAAALSPRMSIGDIVAEPLRIQGRDGVAYKVTELLEAVGLDPGVASRLPRALSGGQRQRVVIARALALDPRLLVLDEPVASLDVSVQAQVLNLLSDLQAERGFGALLIAHDLAVVSSVADRIGVMYLGRIVEEGPAEQVIASPRHPYTQMLVNAIPAFTPAQRRERVAVSGDPATPWDDLPGCTFAPRCPLATDVCLEAVPAVRPVDGVEVACHHA